MAMNNSEVTLITQACEVDLAIFAAPAGMDDDHGLASRAPWRDI
jgi:hypothetical protein